jgi:hypothetical protein
VKVLSSRQRGHEGDMTEPRDDQYEAEVTDSDEIDPLDFPPDALVGVDDLLDADVPMAGDYAPDDLRRRQRRLRPDAPRAEDPERGLVAPELTDTAEPGETDWDVVDPGAALSDSTVTAHHPADTWPAEEAAVHIEEDAGAGRVPDDEDDLDA